MILAQDHQLKTWYGQKVVAGLRSVHAVLANCLTEHSQWNPEHCNAHNFCFAAFRNFRCQSESQSAGNGYSIRDKVTCPMSRAGCMAPPFMFTHYLCINAPGWPIPRAQRLQTRCWGCKRLQMCIYVAAGLDPVSPWRDGSMQTFSGLCLVLVLWAARPCVEVRCLQDLSRTWWDGGPGGSSSRDNSPSVDEVSACDHPALEEKGKSYLPMAMATPVLELCFGFILEFGKDASNLCYRKQRK